MLALRTCRGLGEEMLGMLPRRVRALDCDPLKDYPRERLPERVGASLAYRGSRWNSAAVTGMLGDLESIQSGTKQDLRP